MRIEVNGDPVDVKGQTLTAILEELGHADARVATAVNEEFVPITLRDQTALNEGDRLEIVAPRQGG
ncbi:MAG: sulfur carrier protein ThiS [Pseudomonadota bacterium]